MEEHMSNIKVTRTAEISVKTIISEIRDTMRKILHESLDNIIDGKVSLEDMALTHLAKMLNELDKSPDTQAKKLVHYENIAELWTNYCSDTFFSENPRIEDVIMVVSEGKDGEALEKFWVCRNIYVSPL
jgi:hypothetical protein